VIHVDSTVCPLSGGGGRKTAPPPMCPSHVLMLRWEEELLRETEGGKRKME